MQAILVPLINPPHVRAPLVGILSARRERGRIFAAILRRADRRLCRAWREILLVETEFFDRLADQAQRVVLIVDREATRVAAVQLLEILAQDTHTQAGKGRDKWEIVCILRAQQTLDALSHLIGGFVRKRNRENIPTRNFLLRDEIRDAMRDDASFA